MTRTTTRRRRELNRFITNNSRLFPFAGLFLLGMAVGVAVYLTAAESLAHLLAPATTEGLGFWPALWGCLFAPLSMLAALYLLGLWGCGAPFILVIPLLHGVGVGLTEAYCYRLGATGVTVAAGLVMPIGLLTAALLTMAGAESLRLSVGLSRQLLSGDKDNLSHGFRLYSLRFLLFFGATLVIGLLDLMLRRLWTGYLPV